VVAHRAVVPLGPVVAVPVAGTGGPGGAVGALDRSLVEPDAQRLAGDGAREMRSNASGVSSREISTRLKLGKMSILPRSLPVRPPSLVSAPTMPPGCAPWV